MIKDSQIWSAILTTPQWLQIFYNTPKNKGQIK